MKKLFKKESGVAYTPMITVILIAIIICAIIFRHEILNYLESFIR